MNRQEAVRIVGMMTAAHPAWKATEATVALWCDMLADLPYDTTDVAVRRLIATDDGWPQIAKVRRAVVDLAGHGVPTLDVACAQFVGHARGYVTDVHPLVHETVAALGGWPHVRSATNVSVLLGQFRQLYQPASERHWCEVAGLDGPVARELSAGSVPQIGAVS